MAPGVLDLLVEGSHEDAAIGPEYLHRRAVQPRQDVGPDHRFRRALRSPSANQVQHLIGDRQQWVDIMSGKKHRHLAFATQTSNQCHQVALVGEVKVGQRLVEEQELRFPDQRLGQQ